MAWGRAATSRRRERCVINHLVTVCDRHLAGIRVRDRFRLARYAGMADAPGTILADPPVPVPCPAGMLLKGRDTRRSGSEGGSCALITSFCNCGSLFGLLRATDLPA